ncbi:hypothetical protein J4573_22500 [Actinomadura barringtoniae]|uniref:Uncharacterized protein n=1 Tax=Actinomadura barringtoniae TaxID=1427535 RepID=A0A939TB87_9ACTN|nr:hypothetical protein [Actinomadura barringtoniae]MBO2449890.1 hypothetical protein [Actinomadura barringtoniae]
MPREHARRRFRRLGSASTAVSAGALVLLFMGAPAAYAESSAVEQKCKKGTDPASTIENWKCNLGNLREKLTPKKPAATPKPTPSKKPPLKKGSSSDDGSSKTPKKSSGSSGGGGTGTLPSGGSGGATTLNAPGSVQPYSGKVPTTTPNLPGVLPTPQVAADPSAYQRTSSAPQTRLVSSAEATPPRNDLQIVWVAAAAGAAGAVGALNISVLGRRLRQRARS